MAYNVNLGWISPSLEIVTYFSKSNFFTFTAGENINATSVSGTEVTVTWDQPANIYIDLNAADGVSPTLQGNM